MKIIKETKGMCPVCGKLLPATVTEEDGAIWIRRTCPDHGEFRSLYWSDAEMYHRFEQYDREGRGVYNPNTNTPGECTQRCGLCSHHKSGTLLANIDLTNRCNLNCEFCFANARACGYIYEPTFDEIVSMLSLLRNEEPVPCPAVQFAGGEPTMRDDLVEIIKKAKEFGFSQVQMASNGIKLARNPDLAKELREAGLSTVYLHFDGTTKETNPLLEKTSLPAIENCRKAGLGIVLVPTVINGKNDHQIGDIIRFAAKNIDVIRGINFQPVAFTGAAKNDDVERERVTVPDLVERMEEQTGGALRRTDFYPVPSMMSVCDLIESYTGEAQIMFCAHPHCGAATYGFVNEKGDIVPVNRFIDVDKFLSEVAKMAEKFRSAGKTGRYLAMVTGINNMRKIVEKGEVEGIKIDMNKMIYNALIKHDYNSIGQFHKNALFIGTMHFMDCFNYDTDRVERCCIHYATPDGRLIPFCTYNSGPVYREQVWKKYAKPMPAKKNASDTSCAGCDACGSVDTTE
ncbi:MAG TPA: radical SAM protein [Methanocorpusculum sp.]|nr:radical SAM protein [Methanocorpusculum sp.]HJK06072.1 radical SAM protein [Methanocorpusculum sp.]HJK08829.1 radical SAM protein [Methanocorpusculum sp.]HJK10646.1 radical SAM protein [Methanocorpusculum sp.]HJK15660.1 radical SAM protein [Methanocorpusculum sp.]